MKNKESLMGQTVPGVIETRVVKGKNTAINSDARKIVNLNKIETRRDRERKTNQKKDDEEKENRKENHRE